jgi:hypothetical protein
MVGGYVGGLAAAAAGAGDYFVIPPDSHDKRIATVHATLNLGLLGLYSLNLLLRARRRPPTGAVPVLLNALGTAGLLVSAWYGGHLVYAHGMRVAGVDPLAGAPELRPPGDERLEAALDRLAEAQAGPHHDEPRGAPHDHGAHRGAHDHAPHGRGAHG